MCSVYLQIHSQSLYIIFKYIGSSVEKTGGHGNRNYTQGEQHGETGRDAVECCVTVERKGLQNCCQTSSVVQRLWEQRGDKKHD